MNKKSFLYNPEIHKEIEIEKDSILGRSNKADIVIKDQSISSFHAELNLKENGWTLKDLNSSNSTFLNGKELKPEKEYKLKIGDMILLGDILFFWSSFKPNDKAIEDCQKEKGTFNNTKTGLILRDYASPIGNEPKANEKVTLKTLRDLKTKIEMLEVDLNKQQDFLKGKKKLLTKLEKKREELNLIGKDFVREEIINNIKEEEEKSDEIIREKKELLKEQNKIEKQIDKLKKEFFSFEKNVEDIDQKLGEKKENIKNLKERLGKFDDKKILESEIKKIEKELDYDSVQHCQDKIEFLEETLEEERENLRVSQDQFGKGRFGKKSLYE